MGQINNISTLVRIMAWHRPGDKPLSEPMMENLHTRICVIQSRCVKIPVKKLSAVSPSFWHSRNVSELWQLTCMYFLHYAKASAILVWHTKIPQCIPLELIMMWHISYSTQSENGWHFRHVTVSWMKIVVIWLRFYWSWFAMDQLTINHNWFR